MEMKLEIPFQQFLRIVMKLSPSQKARLKAELDRKEVASKEKEDFIKFLLNGPVYSDEDIQIIEDNRKSIAAWRTKS